MVFQRCWSLLCRVFLCFFRQTTLTGKCGKRARPDVLYEGSAEEEDDDDDDGDDGEAVKQLPFHVIMIVWVEMMLELFFLWMILELQRSWG